jgi:hypothetical protein
MGEPDDPEIEAADARGKAARRAEPRGAAARYDRRLKRMVVELTNGATFAFPVQLAQGLEEASDDELAAVEILGDGYGLHWERLDVDLSIPGLLAGIFGTRSHMARRAGQARSAAKAAASRVNGAKGGRPRRSG